MIIWVMVVFFFLAHTLAHLTKSTGTRMLRRERLAAFILTPQWRTGSAWRP